MIRNTDYEKFDQSAVFYNHVNSWLLYWEQTEELKIKMGCYNDLKWLDFCWSASIHAPQRLWPQNLFGFFAEFVCLHTMRMCSYLQALMTPAESFGWNYYRHVLDFLFSVWLKALRVLMVHVPAAHAHQQPAKSSCPCQLLLCVFVSLSYASYMSAADNLVTLVASQHSTWLLNFLPAISLLVLVPLLSPSDKDL